MHVGRYTFNLPLLTKNENTFLKNIFFPGKLTVCNEYKIMLVNTFQNWKTVQDAQDEDSVPTPDMIRSYGYEVEIHKVLTQDGYINTLHRIPPKGVLNKPTYLHTYYVCTLRHR
jgi:hypothetical protein